MTFYMHKKVHGLGIYILSTYTYPIFSDFKATFWIPSLPFPHDQYARGVVVCCEGAVSYLACLLAGLFTYLLAWLVGWFVS